MRLPSAAVRLLRPLAVLPLLAAVAAAQAPRDTAAWGAIDRANAQFRALRADLAVGTVRKLLESPAARRDSPLVRVARLIEGSSLAVIGRPAEAEPVLREARRRAEAAGKEAQVAQAERYLAYALESLGRTDEAREHYRWLLANALARRDSSHEAFARLGLAYGDLTRGRFAESERGYRRAIALFRATGEPFLLRNALVGLGRSAQALGRPADARRAYQEAAELARGAGDPYSRSDALNNLGTLEHVGGDLAAAEACYREAWKVARTLQGMEVGAATNLALVQIERHRYREAGALLDTALAIARAGGRPMQVVRVLNRLATLRATEGRVAEALAAAREGVALGDRLPEGDRIQAAWAFGTALTQAGALDEALRVLEVAAARLTDRSPAYPACGLRLQLSSTRSRAGRYADALAMGRLALADARRAGSADLEFRAWGAEGLELLRLGRRAEALDALALSVRAWEAVRARQRDAREREHLADIARGTVSSIVAAHLPADGPPTPGDAAAIFETVERFGARTLRERMAGPWRAAPGDSVASVSLPRLQASVLREGELLLRGFVGPQACVLVAVTRHECRVSRLPPSRELDATLLAFHDVCAEPSAAAGPAFAEQAARRMGARMLAPFAGMLAGATRVIVVPDGPLALLPWAALAEPGAADGARPVLDRREVVIAPSATILADLRVRGRLGAAAGGSVLAVTAAEEAGAPPLPGADREARWLAATFAGARAVRTAAAADTATVRAVATADVVHFAAHTTLDDEFPWRSAIRLAPPAGPGADGPLPAERIAALRLRARLAVLSSCTSAGGPATTGEGIGVLAAAFATAGVPATVASLWPVGDRSTEALMRAFYRRLAAGRTAAAALREAQLELRGRPATRHPFHWAGFVVLGDGDVTVPLRRRTPAGAVVAVAVAIAAALGAGARRMRRTPLTDGPGVTPR